MTPVLLFAAAAAVGAAAPAGRVKQKAAVFHPGRIFPLVAVVTVPLILATHRVTLLLSLCIAGLTVAFSIERSRQTRARTQRLSVTAGFLGHLVAALRAGAGVAEGCGRAVDKLPEDTPTDIGGELRRVAANARQGGNAAAILARSEHPELREVGSVWGLSGKLGIPVAELLESARNRIDQQLRHEQATKAALAGPRATAVVLSVLPLAGVLMGQAMGAQPLALLTGGGLGGLLLLVGTALVCAGFATSQRIIAKAAA